MDSIQTEVATFSAFDLHVSVATPGHLVLKLRIGAAEVPALALYRRPLSVDCELGRDAARWLCKGTLQWGAATDKAGSIDFAATFDASSLELQLRRAGTSATATHDRRVPDEWRIVFKDVPLAWFSDALTAQWPVAKSLSGAMDVDAQIANVDGQVDVQTRYALREMTVDTLDGAIAAAHLTAGGKLGIHPDAKGVAFDHSGSLQGGEVLFNAFYIKFPAGPVALDLHARRERNSVWNIASLQLDDPQVLHLEVNASIDTAQATPIRELDLSRVEVALPQAYARYAQAWLAPHALGDLQTHGSLRGAMRWDSQGTRAFALQADDVGIRDAQGRGAVDGLTGSVDWRRDEAAPATSLAWKSAQLYQLPFDAAKWNWRSVDGALSLEGSTTLPLLGGAVEVARLSIRPVAERGERRHAALAMHDIDMRRFSKALGWPSFGGTLGGGVPDLRYHDNILELGGGLMLNVFDGTLNVTGLSIERPFGAAPSLAADIAFSNLDLKLLTGTFDFGEISGRLSGAIKALRLLAWSPVSFDAELHALDGGKISQRAVKNLSSVGGGGISAGLQASMLRLFDQFGYSRLGLRCRLENNVCHMNGLDSAGQGYSIVEGRGLPRISIVGHQDDVDWPVLVERLKAATSGTAPIIE